MKILFSKNVKRRKKNDVKLNWPYIIREKMADNNQARK